MPKPLLFTMMMGARCISAGSCAPHAAEQNMQFVLAISAAFWRMTHTHTLGLVYVRSHVVVRLHCEQRQRTRYAAATSAAAAAMCTKSYRVCAVTLRARRMRTSVRVYRVHARGAQTLGITLKYTVFGARMLINGDASRFTIIRTRGHTEREGMCVRVFG